MHNGGVNSFSQLKFDLQQEVAKHWSKELFLFPQGNTGVSSLFNHHIRLPSS